MEHISDLNTISLIETKMDNCIPLFVIEKNNIISKIIGITTIFFDPNRDIIRNMYQFHNNTYLYYVIDGKYYVDINHILSKLTDNHDIYKNTFREFSEFISLSMWMKKENNEYILRELIDVPTMARLILKFNGEFSSTFRYECMMYLIFIYCLIYFFCVIKLFYHKLC